MRLQFPADYGIDARMKVTLFFVLSFFFAHVATAEKEDCIARALGMVSELNMNDSERATRVGQICVSVSNDYQLECDGLAGYEKLECLKFAREQKQLVLEIETLRKLFDRRQKAEQLLKENPAEAG